jgi:hypothetical protein
MRKYFLVAIYIICFAFGAFAQGNKQACPSISVIVPAGVTFYGNDAVFTVNLDRRGVNNINEANLSYQWSVSVGDIEDGQGTPSISVHVPTESTNNNLWATVTITGLPQGCASSFKERTPISPTCALPVTVDEYGRQSFKDERARLANLAIQLNTNPESGALFVIYVTPKESNSFINKRITNIKNYLAKRFSITETRLRFVFAAQYSYQTKIYLIPPGAMNDFPGAEPDLKRLRPNKE